ncbi:MAG: chemotaxis protein CheA [Oceanococcaceae bacterium]
MSLDMSQFHQTFFDESFEGLDAMESGLLGLDPSAESVDPEVVNAIFRAAHSIKGGAGTFGFAEIGGFTHLLETLLEEMRSLKRRWSSEIVDVLLKGVDATRAMLEAATRNEPIPSPSDLEQRLQDILAHGTEAEAMPERQSSQPESDAADKGMTTWDIQFVPEPDVAQQGNDPLRILRALASLGNVTTHVDSVALKPLTEHDAETCPLGWDVQIETAASEADIRDIFAWVEDACSLQMTRRSTPSAPVAIAPAAADPASAASSPKEQGDKPASGPAPAAAAGPKPKKDSVSTSSIRVSVDKIDMLINLVGELVITQAMLQQRGAALDPVEHESVLTGLSQLDRNIRHLQEAVMSTRMLPVDFVFSRFPRLVRDTASGLGKQVKLITEGEGAELDKGVIEKIVDPLNHIVRNAIDHGVEMPADRKAAGKDATATVRLSAWHQGGNIVIEVADDGKGLDREKILAKARKNGVDIAEGAPDSEVFNLIFLPGLSTAEKVTGLSGRGVGMDVVKRNIQSLGGAVDVSSELGKGTRVTIRLPLTLAILDGMTVRVGDDIMVLPLASVVESMQVQPADLRSVGGERSLLKVREEFVPVIRMDEFFGYRGSTEADRNEASLVVVVEDDHEKVALVINELVGQQQVVVKNLETHYKPVPGIAGATILGDGRVSLIVDVGGLQRAARQRSRPIAA